MSPAACGRATIEGARMFCAEGSSSKGSFLQQKKAAREDRAHEKRREAAATLIQAQVRAWLARVQFSKRIL